MKILSIFIIFLFSKCIKGQFEDDQNYWESSERKMSEIEAKDETPKQHNFFSAHYDNLHHTSDVEHNLDLYDRSLNERASNIGFNMEADKASNFSTTRLEPQSKLIGSNGDNVKSIGSIVSGVQIESKEIQKKSSATDYNIFDAKSTVKDQTMTLIPTTTLKPASDQIMKYNNITILILDENDRIHNKLSVPILNTSHIIIKAFSNNIISDLPLDSFASKEKFYQSTETSKEQATTTKTAALGKTTNTSLNSQALDHTVFPTSTSTQFPNSSINTAGRNSVELKVKNPEHFIPPNTHHNEVVVNDQYKAGEFHEHSNLRTAALKTNENHTEHTSNTTNNSMGRITSGMRSSSAQPVPTSSIFYNQKQINGSIIMKSAVEDLDSKSSNEPTIFKMSKSTTEREKSVTTHSLKIYTENSTSTTNHIDSTTGISANYFSPTKPSKETILKNNSIPGAQDLHLSLKPAILEIIEENTDRNKNMSSKNHFVNVYVPTFEFTQPKNNSMQANQQFTALEDGKISNSGRLELLRIESHTQKETITSRPAKNSVHEIETNTSIDKRRSTTEEGLTHSKTNDILSKLMLVGSKVTLPTASSVTLKPYSSQFIDHTSSLTRSLEEETNALIDILLGQQNKSTVTSYDKFSSMATTQHPILHEKAGVVEANEEIQ